MSYSRGILNPTNTNLLESYSSLTSGGEGEGGGEGEWYHPVPIIVGSVIGSVVPFAIITLLIICGITCCCRLRKRRKLMAAISKGIYLASV